jgi:phage gpG-like protein
MNVEITVTKDKGLQDLFKRLAKLPEILLGAVGKGLAAGGPVIVGNAVKHRFTNQRGPFPVSQNKLGRVTGRLRQSITNTRPQINPASGEVTMGFGSNVSYFAVHEFGFKGTVAVKAHTRRNNFGKKGFDFSLLAGKRNVDIPARAPMTTELRHQRTTDIILENVRRAVVRALDGMEGGPA